MSQVGFRRGLVGLFVLAVLIRVVYVLQMQASPAFEAPFMDALYHWEWAGALAGGERFQEGPFFRAPLYPWFLGLIRALAGDSLLAPRLVQCLLGGVTTVLVALLARRAFCERTGLVAGLACATYWVLVYYDGELLIPTLLAPLTLGALLATMRAHERPDIVRCLAAGGLWGLSILARPNALVLLPVLAVGLLLSARRRSEPGRGGGLLSAAALLAGAALVIAPITSINAARGDQVLVSSQGGVNFWIGNNPVSDGATAIVPGTRGGWWEGYHDSVAAAERYEGRELLASEVSRHYFSRALEWMRAEPRAALTHLGWKLRLLFVDWELGNNQAVRFFSHRYGGIVRLLPLGFGVVVALGLLGLGLAMRDPELRRRSLLLATFLVVYAGTVVAFFVCARFRAPLLPVLFVFAAHAVVQAFDAARARSWRGVLPAALAVGVGLASPLMRPASIKTSDGNGYLQLGTLARGAGDPVAAEAHFRYATQLDPGNLFARIALGRVLLDSGDLSGAERELRAALQLDPFRPDALDVLCAVLLERGDDAGLEQLIGGWQAGAPDLASTRFWLGRLRAKQGRLPAAQGLFEEASRLDPRGFAMALAWGVVARARGEHEAALEAFLRAASCAPGQASEEDERAAYQGLAELLEAAGRAAEAQQWRERAAQR